MGPGLSRVGLGYSCVTDRKTGRWQTRFGHLFSRRCLCVSLFCWSLELCLCGKSFRTHSKARAKRHSWKGPAGAQPTCMGKTEPLKDGGIPWVTEAQPGFDPGSPVSRLTLLIPPLPVPLDPGPRSPFASQMVIRHGQFSTGIHLFPQPG